MKNEKIGPLMTDEEFYSSLSSDIPMLIAAKERFEKGDGDGAASIFFEYIKTNLECEKFFSAIEFDPSSAPSDICKKQADDALEYNMVSCDIYHKFDGKVDWYSNHTYNNYEEWTWQLSRHAQIFYLSHVYQYTKNEIYAKRAIELLDSWMKQAVAPTPDTDGHTTLCWRTIECGIRMNVWAKILATLLDSPALTPRFLVDFFKSVFEHAERLYYKNTAANWLIIEMNGLYITSLLYPFFKRSVAWHKLAKDTFISQMDEQTLADGTHYELSFGYQRVSLNGFCDVLKIGEAFGDKFPDKYMQKLRLQLHAIAKVMMPNGDAPPVNDGKFLDIPKLMKNYAVFFKDDELLRFIVDNENSTPPKFTTAYFENAGFVAFRSDWTKNAVAAFFDGGKFGKCHNHEDVIRCHQHEDKLNFLMYVGDKNVICEAESYAYDTSKMRYHVLSSEAHNTAIVNGMGQSRLANNRWDESMLTSIVPLTYKTIGNIEYAEAEYNEGYGKDAEIYANHKRCIYFVKKSSNSLPFFIIKDSICSDRVRDFDIIWHYNTEKLDVVENKAFCSDITTMFAGDSGEISVFFGSEEPFRAWRSHSFVQGDFSPVPTLYYRVRAERAEVVTAFIPNVRGECQVSRIEYKNGIITVIYNNGERLEIDF